MPPRIVGGDLRGLHRTGRSGSHRHHGCAHLSAGYRRLPDLPQGLGQGETAGQSWSLPLPGRQSRSPSALIEPTLTAWRQQRARNSLRIGRRPEHDLRAIPYVDRTGIPWRYLPREHPPWQTVYGNFADRRHDGIFTQLTGLSRQLVRTAEGGTDEPTACVMDSQSIKTSTNAPTATQGIDAAKKIVGRKPSIATDTLGLLLATLVTAASVQDTTTGTHLLTHLATAHPTVAKAWVDGGYRTTLIEEAPPSASTSKSSTAPLPPKDSPPAEWHRG
ncbi:transposase [Nonomuraea sp. NPDC049758]|uniref:transposase n=1 Tax=Nonomuraea sp. NPDC049758 TaxID=3154360 RepID=UPI00344003BA